MMPQSIAAWDQQQWGVFVAVLAAGLLAILLAPVAVRLRADVRAGNLDRWERRRRRAIADATGPLTPIVDAEERRLAEAWHDEVTAQHVGLLQPVEPLVDDDVRAALDDALGRALEDFRVAVEPQMRKARLWTLRGGESYAQNAIATWRILEQTAEYPLVPAHA